MLIYVKQSPTPPLHSIRNMMIVRRLRWNIIRTALCWIVWHNVHSQQHLYEQFLQVNRLGLSHWDPNAMCRGSCLELYYCNMVEWFWWDSSLSRTDLIVPKMTCNMLSGILSNQPTSNRWMALWSHHTNCDNSTCCPYDNEYCLSSCPGVPVPSRSDTVVLGGRLSACLRHSPAPTPLVRFTDVCCLTYTEHLQRSVLCCCRSTGLEFCWPNCDSVTLSSGSHNMK